MKEFTLSQLLVTSFYDLLNIIRPKNMAEARKLHVVFEALEKFRDQAVQQRKDVIKSYEEEDEDGQIGVPKKYVQEINEKLKPIDEKKVKISCERESLSYAHQEFKKLFETHNDKLKGRDLIKSMVDIDDALENATLSDKPKK